MKKNCSFEIPNDHQQKPSLRAQSQYTPKSTGFPHVPYEKNAVIVLDLMWVKPAVMFIPSPSHHHFYSWYGYHSQSWLVYGIVLPTLTTLMLLLFISINHL